LEEFILEVKSCYCGKVNEIVNRILSEYQPLSSNLPFRLQSEGHVNVGSYDGCSLNSPDDLSYSQDMQVEGSDLDLFFTSDSDSLDSVSSKFLEGSLQARRQKNDVYIHALNRPENNMNVLVQQQQHEEQLRLIKQYQLDYKKQLQEEFLQALHLQNLRNPPFSPGQLSI